MTDSSYSDENKFKEQSVVELIQEGSEKLVTPIASLRWVEKFPMVFALVASLIQVLVISLYKAGALNAGKFNWGLEDLAIYLIGVLSFYVVFRAILAPFVSKLADQIDMVGKENNALTQLNRATTLGLSQATEVRDIHSRRQIRSIGIISQRIAQELSRDENYKDYLTDQYIADLRVAAPLYDLGRIGLPDSLLDNIESYTNEQVEMMKMHVVIGGDLISELQKALPYRTYFSMAKEIIYHHHQRWDGNGYPNVLKDGGSVSYFVQSGIGEPLVGEEIPLSARIVSITDAYNALITDKPYKQGLSHDEACQVIAEEKGRQFDPMVVKAFLRCRDDLRQIAEQY